MKAAVVGAGAWGKNLIRTLYSVDALAAIVEVNDGLRATLVDQYPDVALYSDIEQLVASDIPAALIAVPASLHFTTAKKLLEAGKDLFVEKPLTLSVDESEELVHLAEKQSLILMVGHLLIYQSAVRWIKDSIEAGKIGRLCSIHQARCGLGRARSVENVLWSIGVHDVAVIQYLVGSTPFSLQVIGQKVVQKDIEDDVYLHMTFDNGIQTHMHCSWLWPQRDRTMTIIGTKGMYVYNELEQTVMYHGKGIGPDLKNIEAESELVFQGNGEPLKVEVEHFLDCVRDRSTPISDGVSGLEVIRTLEQAAGGL